MLEHAVAQPMMAIMIERQAEAKVCAEHWNQMHKDDPIKSVRVASPLDLIALVNPANDAFEAKAVIEGLKRAGLSDTEFESPLIVSLKSEGDNATGGIMKFAQSLTEWQLTMHPYDRGTTDARIPSACDEGQLGLHTQSFYYSRSAPGIYSMRSHEVSQVSAAANKISCEGKNQQAPATERYFWSANFNREGCYKIESVSSILARDTGLDHTQFAQYYSCSRAKDQLDVKDGETVSAWNDTPYYVMGVPSSLISDHNDIFQQGLFSLLTSLLVKSDRATGSAVTVPVQDREVDPH